jgi:hypothetical protein
MPGRSRGGLQGTDAGSSRLRQRCPSKIGRPLKGIFGLLEAGYPKRVLPTFRAAVGMTVSTIIRIRTLCSSDY